MRAMLRVLFDLEAGDEVNDNDQIGEADCGYYRAIFGRGLIRYFGSWRERRLKT